MLYYPGRNNLIACALKSEEESEMGGRKDSTGFEGRGEGP